MHSTRRHRAGSKATSFEEGDRVKFGGSSIGRCVLPKNINPKDAKGTVIEQVDNAHVRVKWEGAPPMAKGSVIEIAVLAHA